MKSPLKSDDKRRQRSQNNPSPEPAGLGMTNRILMSPYFSNPRVKLAVFKMGLK
jgi:hypothetical protein